MTTFQARVWFRKGGFDRRAWCNIVEGWRAEVLSGCDEMIYTGVCETRADAIAELITHLKARGHSGKLQVSR